MNIALPSELQRYIELVYGRIDNIPTFRPMVEVDECVYNAYRAWVSWRDMSMDRMCLNLSSRADEIYAKENIPLAIVTSMTLLDNLEDFLEEEMSNDC